MTDEEIRRSIRLGEDSAMEFKSIQVTPSRVISPDARVVADEFANWIRKAGGTIRHLGSPNNGYWEVE